MEQIIRRIERLESQGYLGEQYLVLSGTGRLLLATNNQSEARAYAGSSWYVLTRSSMGL